MTETKKTGTTTVGLRYSDGVVLASDRKMTLGYLVAGKNFDKVFKITDNIGMTVAGSVGDVQALVRILRAELALFELQRDSSITVKSAATFTSNVLQGNKMMPYMGQFVMGGYDSAGPCIYSLDPLGSLSEENDYVSTGSGSPFAYGVLEAEYSEGMDMVSTVRTAVRAISAAKERDIASGGRGFAIAVIDSNGYRELSQEEIQKYIE